MATDLREHGGVSGCPGENAGHKRDIIPVLDGAGCHTTPLLRCPDGITLVFLPPYSPELQSAERLWQRTDVPLENRHFETLTQLQKTLAAQCCWLEKQQNRIAAYLKACQNRSDKSCWVQWAIRCVISRGLLP
ncbi:transposase [Deinococcus rubellus]|uniref:transposase n=1 Tax=Deinococcus rubellus TaxID=1889240 RepID=UPI003CD0580E